MGLVYARKQGEVNPGGFMTVTLVLGGARSGKSGYAKHAAEVAAQAAGGRLVMLVTAQALDDEMKARIAAHRAGRGKEWTTVDAPVDLGKAVAALKPDDRAVIDCLTVWASNLLAKDIDIEEATSELLEALSHRRSPTWLISNEIGSGVVPEDAETRRFRDLCGRLHQRMAAEADQVVLMVAGLPLQVK